MLNDKQKLFCLYYVRSFNATEAYLKAYGCKYDTARANVHRLLAKDSIKQEIATLKAEKIELAKITQEDVFERFVKIAFSDITDVVYFCEDEVKLKSSGEIEPTAIAEIQVSKQGVKVKLADKMRALDWLSRYIGMTTDEQRARIDKLKAETARITGEDLGTDQDDGFVDALKKEAGAGVWGYSDD